MILDENLRLRRPFRVDVSDVQERQRATMVPSARVQHHHSSGDRRFVRSAKKLTRERYGGIGKIPQRERQRLVERDHQ